MTDKITIISQLQTLLKTNSDVDILWRNLSEFFPLVDTTETALDQSTMAHRLDRLITAYAGFYKCFFITDEWKACGKLSKNRMFNIPVCEHHETYLTDNPNTINLFLSRVETVRHELIYRNDAFTFYVDDPQSDSIHFDW